MGLLDGWKGGGDDINQACAGGGRTSVHVACVSFERQMCLPMRAWRWRLGGWMLVGRSVPASFVQSYVSLQTKSGPDTRGFCSHLCERLLAAGPAQVVHLVLQPLRHLLRHGLGELAALGVCGARRAAWWCRVRTASRLCLFCRWMDSRPILAAQAQPNSQCRRIASGAPPTLDEEHVGGDAAVGPDQRVGYVELQPRQGPRQHADEASKVVGLDWGGGSAVGCWRLGRRAVGSAFGLVCVCAVGRYGSGTSDGVGQSTRCWCRGFSGCPGRAGAGRHHTAARCTRALSLSPLRMVCSGSLSLSSVTTPAKHSASAARLRTCAAILTRRAHMRRSGATATVRNGNGPAGHIGRLTAARDGNTDCFSISMARDDDLVKRVGELEAQAGLCGC
jgi:hypothetical protein